MLWSRTLLWTTEAQAHWGYVRGSVEHSSNEGQGRSGIYSPITFPHWKMRAYFGAFPSLCASQTCPNCQRAQSGREMQEDIGTPSNSWQWTPVQVEGMWAEIPETLLPMPWPMRPCECGYIFVVVCCSQGLGSERTLLESCSTIHLWQMVFVCLELWAIFYQSDFLGAADWTSISSSVKLIWYGPRLRAYKKHSPQITSLAQTIWNGPKTQIYKDILKRQDIPGAQRLSPKSLWRANRPFGPLEHGGFGQSKPAELTHFCVSHHTLSLAPWHNSLFQSPLVQSLPDAQWFLQKPLPDATGVILSPVSKMTRSISVQKALIKAQRCSLVRPAPHQKQPA